MTRGTFLIGEAGHPSAINMMFLYTHESDHCVSMDAPNIF